MLRNLKSPNLLVEERFSDLTLFPIHPDIARVLHEDGRQSFFRELAGFKSPESSADIQPLVDDLLSHLRNLRVRGDLATDDTLLHLRALTLMDGDCKRQGNAIKEELMSWLTQSDDLRAVSTIICSWLQASEPRQDSRARTTAQYAERLFVVTRPECTVEAPSEVLETKAPSTPMPNVIRKHPYVLEQALLSHRAISNDTFNKLRRFALSPRYSLADVNICEQGPPPPYEDQLLTRNLYAQMPEDEKLERYLNRIHALGDPVSLATFLQKEFELSSGIVGHVRSIAVYGSAVYGGGFKANDLDLYVIVDAPLPKPVKIELAAKWNTEVGPLPIQAHFMTAMQLGRSGQELTRAANFGIVLKGGALQDLPLEVFQAGHHIENRLAGASQLVTVGRDLRELGTKACTSRFLGKSFRRFLEANLLIASIDISCAVDLFAFDLTSAFIDRLGRTKNIDAELISSGDLGAIKSQRLFSAVQAAAHQLYGAVKGVSDIEQALAKTAQAWKSWTGEPDSMAHIEGLQAQVEAKSDINLTFWAPVVLLNVIEGYMRNSLDSARAAATWRILDDSVITGGPI